MTNAQRDELIQAFHLRALDLLEADDEKGANRPEIARLRQELARQPGILPNVPLERLHDAGSTATILHQGDDGRGALMLLRLPDDAPTPVHNHNTWGVAVVIQGESSGASITVPCKVTPPRAVGIGPREGDGGGSGGEETNMPQRAWSKKRERQYEHVKEGLQERGRSEDTAEEIAARTVNKERARAGESEQASRTSTDDMSSGRRGGLRSHAGPGGRTRDQLYAEAKSKGIKGRSKMSKAELEKAVGR